MNPRRLWSLFDAYFRPSPHREVSQSLQTGENSAKNAENEGMSLSAYLMGGGR